jgi:carbamoyl-phosphate synthase large subunit
LIKSFRLSESVKYTIIGTDITKISKGMMEVDIPEVVPAASHSDYIPKLLELCIRYNVKALFPGSEPELKVISLFRDQFLKRNIFLPINSEEVLNICFDKFKTADFLNQNNFSCPLSVRVTSENDLKAIDFYPAVLKPSVGGSGSANIMLAQSQQELLVFGRYLLNSFSEFIVQEYIGTPDHEYTVGVLSSMEGELINSIALRRTISSGLGCKIKVKNRTGRSELGENLIISSGISQGEIGKFSFITKVCEKIALSIGAKSAINIQCRYYNNRVYVFEINPRFSGTTSLRAMMGYNEPDILIRKYLLNEKISNHFLFKEGTIMRGLNEVIIN